MTSLVAMEMNDRDHEDDQLLDADSFDGLALLDKSEWYGGDGGGEYKDKPRFPYDQWYVESIQVCGGGYVDSLTVRMKNWKTHETYYVARRGGGGGSCKSITVTNYPQDCINAMHVRSGAHLDWVEFVKANGEVLNMGGEGGGFHSIFLDNACLSGLRTRAGSYIDRVGAYYTKIPQDFLDKTMEPPIR